MSTVLPFFGREQEALDRCVYSAKSSPSVIFPPARFVNSAVRFPQRTLQGFASSDRISAEVSFPFAHARSTSNPPRALNPFTLPRGHAFGSAGRSSTSPPWL